MSDDHSQTSPASPQGKRKKAPSSHCPYSHDEIIDIYVRMLAEGRPFNEIYKAWHPDYQGKEFSASTNGKAFYRKHRSVIDVRVEKERSKTAQITDSLGIDLSRERLVKKLNDIISNPHEKTMDVLKAVEISIRMMGYNAPTVSLSGKVDPVKALSDVIQSRLAGVPPKELPQSVDVVDIVPKK